MELFILSSREDRGSAAYYILGAFSTLEKAKEYAADYNEALYKERNIVYERKLKWEQCTPIQIITPYDADLSITTVIVDAPIKEHA